MKSMMQRASTAVLLTQFALSSIIRNTVLPLATYIDFRHKLQMLIKDQNEKAATRITVRRLTHSFLTSLILACQHRAGKLFTQG